MTIDWWSLGIQAVNVLILVWLLGRFFWKPVAAMIEQRKAAAVQMLADAKAQQDQAAAALADIERTRASFAQERDAILADAHAAAERERGVRLDAATKEAAAIAADAQAAAAKDKTAVDAAWHDRAGQLAIDIAARLCAPLAGPAAQALFVDRLLQKVRSLPPAERALLSTPGAPIEAVSPQALDAGQQARLHDGLVELFGASPQFVFSNDPTLIAGLELRGAHLSVSNSWRADLQHIRLDLAHDSTA